MISFDPKTILEVCKSLLAPFYEGNLQLKETRDLFKVIQDKMAKPRQTQFFYLLVQYPFLSIPVAMQSEELDTHKNPQASIMPMCDCNIFM